MPGWWSSYWELPAGLSRVERHWYRVALAVFPLGGIAHVGLLAAFGSLGLHRLALLNVVSIAAWVVGAAMLRRGWILAATSAIALEVVVHAFFANATLGLAAGFPSYLLTVPVVAAMAPAGERWFARIATGFGLVGLVAMVVWGLVVPPWAEVGATVASVFLVANVTWVFLLLYAWNGYFERLTASAEADLAAEKARSEDLLHNILPVAVADQLRAGRSIVADRHESASVLFADLVGFTVLSERVEAQVLVSILDDLFRGMDDLVARYGLEKIKTIGDAYMVAAGVPDPVSDHADRLVGFALDAAAFVDRYGAERQVALQVRVGIHSGPLVAGVIGKRKFAYDLWGDTVNTAARMESHGVPGRVQVSEATAALLSDQFAREPRGTIEVKGKGPMATFLVSRAG